MNADGPKPTPRGPRNEINVMKMLVGVISFVVAYVMVKCLTANLMGHR